MPHQSRIVSAIFFLVTGFLSLYSQNDWDTLARVTNHDLSSVFFIGDTGFAAGGNGQTNGNVLIKTNNGGLDWETFITKNQLYSIFFTETTTGYAIDYYGILKTTNGGENWSRVFDNESLSKYSYLSSLYFVNSDTGYCVGGFSDYNPILKTTNGGVSWSDLSSNFNKPLNSVFFTNSTTGYAVGNAGTIIKTTDGGQNWTKKNSGTLNTLNSVFFADANNGYTIGCNGTVLKTTDGGNNWTTLNIGTSNRLGSVWFIDKNTGYIVGGKKTYVNGYPEPYEQTILRTGDGGKTWNTQTSGDYNFLYSICFSNTNIGYAVGMNGTVIRTEQELTQASSSDKFKNTLNIYPNPAKTILYVDLDHENYDCKIIVTDLSGKPLILKNIENNENKVSLENLKNGIYLISVYNLRTGKKIMTTKLFKE